jgi:adenylate cyclase
MNKKLLWQWRGVLVTTPLIAVLVILLRSLGLLQSFELRVYDQFIRWKPEQKKDSRLVIVGIDEADVRKIGNPIFPDQIYADVIKKLQSHQPRAIGLDIYRDQPVPPGHEKLVEVFKSYDNIVGIAKVVGDKERETIPPPPILAEKGQIGSNDVMFDGDNTVRRALLALPKEKLFSFAMHLALLYLAQENIKLQTVGEDNWWQLGNKVFVPFESNDGSYHSADAGGYQIIVNYRGATGHFEVVSLSDVLEDKLPPNWGKDRLILIGVVGHSYQDILITPHTNGNASKLMPGVEFHANVASQIISAAMDRDNSNKIMIKTWPDSLENLWIISWAGMGATIAWGMRKSETKKQEFIRRIIVLSVAVFALLGITYAAFLFSWWLPVIPPLIALSGSVIIITVYVARSAGQIRNTFGRYLSSEIVNTLLETPAGIKLGGERKKITILTSDLRGFTAISEKISPEEVVKILNFYLGDMANIITQYQGTIDEFMGDGILVLFGAPISRKDDAERAVACALAMQLKMESINKQMEKWGYSPLQMGIGINTGEVVVGNIGSEKRTKYGVVGSEVNLTYRIESYTIGGQILITEKTLKEIETNPQIRETKEVSPKGVQQPITIYSIGGIKGKYNLYLPKKAEDYIVLADPIKIEYCLLHQKDIGQEISQGKIIKLSSQGAKVAIDCSQDSCPDSLTNIKLTLSNLEKKEDVYAKVMNTNSSKTCFDIYFTHLPLEIAEKLNDLRKNNS